MVWSSQLGAQAKHVAEGAALLPDQRAKHYWDGEQVAGHAFKSFVGTSSAAWDVWLLFEPEVLWEDEPPAPTWWEHQIRGLPAERRLDPERFARQAKELLKVLNLPGPARQ